MSENPLGKATQYVSQYAPKLLFPIPRSEKRNELDSRYLSFQGEDIWNAFELSWLNANGLPQVAIGIFRINCETVNIVESKSLKLYLNSFNQTQFNSLKQVQQTIQQDLSEAAEGNVSVELTMPKDFVEMGVSEFDGELIDEQSITIDSYQYQPQILRASGESREVVTETLVSHLLKSNCLITSQPDWASIQIKYHGPKIDRENLLRYIVSFRSHNEFHEQCVERIFADLKKYCRTEKLTVYARYTRRGGLDINPWRSDFESVQKNLRLARQ